MRFTVFLFLLALAVSCGKNSDGGSPQQETDRRTQGSTTTATTPNVSANAPTSTEFGEAEVIRSTDLLDVTLAETVQITEGEIRFLRDSTMTDLGERNQCTLDVKNGDIYRYSLRGNDLQLETSDGQTYLMTRENGNSNSLIGKWFWRGRENNMDVRKVLTVVNMSKVIMVAHCEG